jgi:hypothetical protein
MKNKSAKTEDKDGDFILISIIVSIVIIGLWFFTYYILKDLEPDERGTFGDMFGSVNAIYSGLALAGIILTILLQRKELKLQREELGETRKEFETQNETLKIQRFENTFFNLLNQHHQIVNSIDLRYYKKKEKNITTLSQQFTKVSAPAEEKEVVVINGRDVFRYRYNKMFKDLEKGGEKIEYTYMKHYEGAQTDFGHYFRNLYRMIKIVEQTDFFYNTEKVTPEQIFKIKYKYTSIIRAQISDYELLWLFYNCLSSNGKEKFKDFIERYSILKNMPKNLLPIQEHCELYNKIAFDPGK